MQLRRRVRRYLLLGALAAAFYPLRVQAQAGPNPASAPAAAGARDGQRDFDFELGTWKIHLKRLLNPLTGSSTWTEFDGTTFTRKVWNGRAELEQFETEGANGRVEGMTLRLYNPKSRQWSLYWANAKDGILAVPTIGEFKDGRGEFYDLEPINGRPTLVRFMWSQITPTSAHFEQSFSQDGGKTWEVNWITDQTRISPEAKDPRPDPGPVAQKPAPDHQHDFDFEFGSWKAHIRRLQHPLTGANEWVELDGTSVVNKIWNGRANLGELEVGNANAHLEGLSLRLYNPQSHQWSIYWSSSQDGSLGTPSVGQFQGGRGEFYDQEMYRGAAIFVRFLFSDITPTSFHFEQAFSTDAGKTWEANWIATFTREQP